MANEQFKLTVDTHKHVFHHLLTYLQNNTIFATLSQCECYSYPQVNSNG